MDKPFMYCNIFVKGKANWLARIVLKIPIREMKKAK
jgi:hypothetical protein